MPVVQKKLSSEIETRKIQNCKKLEKQNCFFEIPPTLQKQKLPVLKSDNTRKTKSTFFEIMTKLEKQKLPFLKSITLEKQNSMTNQ